MSNDNDSFIGTLFTTIAWLFGVALGSYIIGFIFGFAGNF